MPKYCLGFTFSFDLDENKLRNLLREFKKDSYLRINIRVESSRKISFPNLTNTRYRSNKEISEFYYKKTWHERFRTSFEGSPLEFFQTEQSLFEFFKKTKGDVFKVTIYCKCSDDEERRDVEIKFFAQTFNDIVQLGGDPNNFIGDILPLNYEDIKDVKKIDVGLHLTVDAKEWQAFINIHQIFYMNVKDAIAKHGPFQVKGFHFGMNKLWELFKSKTPWNMAHRVTILFSPSLYHSSIPSELANIFFRPLVVKELKELSFFENEYFRYLIKNSDINPDPTRNSLQNIIASENRTKIYETKELDDLSDEELFNMLNITGNELFLRPDLASFLRSSVNGPSDFEFRYSLMPKNLTEMLRKTYKIRTELDVLGRNFRDPTRDMIVIPLPPALVENIRSYGYAEGFDASDVLYLVNSKEDPIDRFVKN